MTSFSSIPFAGGFLAPDNTDTWVLIAFLLFLAVLYFARVHEFIGNALDQRAASIRKQLDEARQLREEAQSKLAEWQRKQREVENQVAEIVDAARREAERSEQEAKAAIENMVAQRVRSAAEQIALAEADAVRAVRNEAVDAAVAATSELLKKTIAGDDASSMMDAAIGEVKTRLN